jgi:hypothetical protein
VASLVPTFSGTLAHSPARRRTAGSTPGGHFPDAGPGATASADAPWVPVLFPAPALAARGRIRLWRARCQRERLPTQGRLAGPPHPRGPRGCRWRLAPRPRRHASSNPATGPTEAEIAQSLNLSLTAKTHGVFAVCTAPTADCPAGEVARLPGARSVARVPDAGLLARSDTYLVRRPCPSIRRWSRRACSPWQG